MISKPVSGDLIWQSLTQIRDQAPLVQNITNFVSAGFVANTLLALGASPIMVQAEEEFADLVSKSKVLVLNIGTLTHESNQVMNAAARLAKRAGVPVIFDPVGAGATRFRTQTADAFLDGGLATVIRGNASEIRSLGESAKQSDTKGVDSQHTVDEIKTHARSLAEAKRTVIAVSGETDLITDGTIAARVFNGHPLMTKVTGMGCAATGVVGAFLAVVENPVMAATYALAVMGIAGELAALKSPSPGSFTFFFHDALYGLSRQDIQSRLRVEVS